MGNSPGRSKSSATSKVSGFSKILQRRILYRCATVAMLLVCIFAEVVATVAQEERPQIMPGERKAAKKKDSGPRALGILQLGANGKASIIPVAILVNGKFWDASAYKADPVPMSLDSGVVYEGMRAGSPLGLFTVGSALHSNNVNAQAPWIGTGSWRPAGTEPAETPLKADNTPVGIEDADAPPRLTRDPKAAKPASSGNPTSGTPQPSSAPKPSESSSDGPPRLSKGSSPSSDSPQSGNAPLPAPVDKPASTSSAGAKGDDTKPAAEAKVPTSDSGADKGDRPVLRHGKPAESFADEEVPGYSRPGATRTSASGKVVETATAAKSDVQLIPAISDASGPPPHSFTFEWVKGDEQDRRTQIVEMAKEQIRAYVTAQAKNRITAKPTHPIAARRTVKAEEPIFENVQMIAYDLWNSNQPVIVFSAQAHMPPPPAGTAHSETDSDMQYSILLVVYPDIYNNLHKVYAGVTDKFHLDVTPRLDLIDAVDADGDGRGELLFRETSDAGTGWVVYRATADKLWKLFDSLSPQ